MSTSHAQALPAIYARAVSLWTWAKPGLPAWLTPYAHAPITQPPAALLPARARGRASLLTRMFSEVIEHVTRGPSGTMCNTLPMIFGTSNGELQVTGVLLQMMNSDDNALSPARFQNSVHSAAAGQLSLALHNRGFGTCVTAGAATAAACLEEAASYLALNGGELVVALADESAPEFLANVEPCEPLAIALRLAASPAPDGSDMQLQLMAAAGPEHAEPAAAIVNPCASLLPLCHALLERRAASVGLGAAWAYRARVTRAGVHGQESSP